MTTPTAQLSQAGVSIWLDDLSRERLTSGNLAELIETKSVVGVTTNPTIFAAALSDGDSYAEQLQGLTDVDEAIQLADRVLVLTDGVISLEEEVSLDRPRDKGDRAFIELRSKLLAELGVVDVSA